MPESQVMSSKHSLELRGDSKAEDAGPGTRRERGGKEGKEGRGAFPDSGGRKKGSSEGLAEGAPQVEETASCGGRERGSHSSAHQASQCEEPVSGGCAMKRHHRRPKLRSKGSSVNRETRRLREELRGPFYFFGGTNGAEIVSKYCESRGWRRIYDKQREDFKLKWCETKSPADYSSFREGEQLLYQIPNNKVLTTKIGLLSSLREYERVTSKVSHGQRLRSLKMEEFVPTTFRMDVREERETFFTQQEGGSNNESRMWICKPTGLNQGRGIFLLQGQEDVAALRLKLQHMEDHQSDRRVHHRRPQAHIVQHYIQKPLLLQGKKFDVRSYLLIACTAPYMVFFRHGYVRLTCDLYDPKSNNLSAHLTNQYMQKKNPLYSQLKEDTVWSMESFNAYVNDRFQVAMGLPRDWVLGTFARRMQQIMTQCFFAVKSKLVCRLGFFDLIGCDFLVDEDFKVWLLEMNCNPALHTNCEVLREVIPSTVTEALDLTLEIFNKCRVRQRIFPLASQRDFVLLYNGSFAANSLLACRRSGTNAEFDRNPRKTEPGRCRSATEGKGVDVPEKPERASASGEGLSRSDSAQRSASTSTTSLVNGNSHSRVRSRSTRPRVELTLGKCTLRPHSKAADAARRPGARREVCVLMSLSSPALSRQSFICGSPEMPFPEEETEGDTKSSVRETKEEV